MRYRKLTKQTSVAGKSVLVRISANVPLTNGRVDKNGTTRLEKLIPTITFLARKKAKIILVTHFGRPQGKRVAGLTVAPIAKRLSKLLQKKITFIPYTVGERVNKTVSTMSGGDILFLENVRFHKEELLNSASFAKQLSSCADVYINEAFADSHRKHASIVSIPLHLPAYAGFQFQEEISTLEKVLTNPKKPLGVVIGGAKIASKVGIIAGLTHRAHVIILGGDVANALIDGERFNRLSPKEQHAVRSVKRFSRLHHSMVLPEDVVVQRGRIILTIPTSQLMPKDTIIDIGIESIERLISILKTTNTVVWNGPLGIFETPEGRTASIALARFLARKRCTTIIGGGETTELINSLHLAKQFTFISTGGGAMLAFLAGDDLPGLKALRT